MDDNEINNEEQNIVSSEDTTSVESAVDQSTPVAEEKAPESTATVEQATPCSNEYSSTGSEPIPVIFDNTNGGSTGDVPGKSMATVALVLSIIGGVLVLTYFCAGIGLCVGIVSLILSIVSKSKGFEGSTRTAAFVISIITLALGLIFFLSCASCMCGGCGLGCSALEWSYYL